MSKTIGARQGASGGTIPAASLIATGLTAGSLLIGAGAYKDSKRKDEVINELKKS